MLNIGEKIIVTTWNNGSYHKSGAGYGIRIPKESMAIVRNWKSMKINNTIIYKKSEMTDKCPEIRSINIGQFLIQNNLNKWVKGTPYELKIIYLGEDNWELRMQL